MPTKIELQQENDSLRTRVLELEGKLKQSRSHVNAATLLLSGFKQSSFAVLLDAMGLGFYAFSGAGNEVVFNKAAGRMLGKGLPCVAQGKPAPRGWELLGADGKPIDPSGLPSLVALRTGKIVKDAVVGLRRQSLREAKWVRVTAVPRFMQGRKKPYYVACVLEEMTRQREVEHALNERVKELEAFYRLSEIISAEGDTLESIYHGIADMLPRSWQYPGITGCRIRFDGREYKTKNFRESRWLQSADIKVNGQQAGSIDICYLAKRPKEDEGPFLTEERLLLDAIANWLPGVVGRYKSDEAIIRSNQRYDLIANLTSDMVWLMDMDFRTTYHSPSVTRLRGFAPEEIMQMTVEQNLTPDSLKTAMEIIIDMLPRYEADPAYNEVPMAELEFTCKYGSTIWAECKFSVMRDVQGKPMGFSILVFDITTRKVAQAELAASEKKYKLIVESAAEGVWLLDKNFVTTYVNPAMQAILGYSGEEMIGHSWYDFGDREWVERAKQLEVNRASGVSETHDFMFIHKNHSKVLTSIVTTPIYDEVGSFNGALGIVSNIGELRECENQLRKSEEQFRLAFKYSTIGMALVSPEGQFINVNDALCNIVGYSENELLSKTFQDITHPEDLDANLSFMRQLLCGKIKSYQMEERYFHKDGHHIWVQLSVSLIVDESGDPIHFISQIQDISEIRCANENLEVAMRNYTLLANHVVDVVWMWSVRTQEFSYVSPSVYRMSGYTVQEVMRMKWEDLVTPKSYQVVMAHMRKQSLYVNGDKPPISLVTEIEHRTKDGAIMIAETTWNMVKDSDGNLMVIGSSRDITQRNKVQKDLSESEQRYRKLTMELEAKVQERTVDLEAAKLLADEANSAKSIFLANMSHEIRTPLNVILGFTQIMLKDRALDGRNRGHLQTIIRSGYHLLTIINEVLEISKIASGQVSYTPSAFSLAVLLKDMQSMFNYSLEVKGLSMELELPPGLLEHIVSDENKVREILINLLDNAIKFTDMGGITLRCRTDIDPSSADPNGFVLWMDIEDTGLGIHEEDLLRIFQPFEQTRKGVTRVGGTGLGLSISQSHAKLMGGEITVTSTPGRGSCFRVRVPILAVPEAMRQEAKRAPVITGLKPGAGEVRVLIVDDNEENRMVLEEMLKPLGLACRSTASGREAVAIAAEWRPRLVLMDLRMPGMDGYEVARTIKAADYGKDIHIIAVTASALDMNMEIITASGMTGYLRKPYKESELHKVLAEQLEAVLAYSSGEPDAGPPGRPEVSKFTGADIAVIPRELRQQVTAAACMAHFDLLMALADRVQAVSPVVAESIRECVRSYFYEGILELFKVEKDNGN